MNEVSSYFGYWIKRFLLEYIINVRNLSKNTQLSYRDTFRLILPYLSGLTKKKPEDILLEDITLNNIISFLCNLEKNRNCSAATRNQRLAAIYALSKFIAIKCPEYVEWSRLIHTIPMKKTPRTIIPYLEREEMDTLLAAPDGKTPLGKRDYVILLFLYNTGARIEEAARLKISDIVLEKQLVYLHGKGNKRRLCPLWKSTVKELQETVKGRDPAENVFLNRFHRPITRFGIYIMVKKYANKVAETIPAIKKKRISPHTIRHTTATHLLQSGVDINTIRAWLGHVSINTTNIYAEVNLKMKSDALSCCEVKNLKKKNFHWRDDKDLMSFLDSL